jgi:hypothetical protein
MDNLNRRAYIGLGKKLKRLPKIWWSSNVTKYQNVERFKRSRLRRL